MRSKAFHAFEQKLIYFDDDIDLLDVIRSGIIKGDLTDKNSKHLLKNIDPKKHTHLARRKNADASRKIVINHLRATVYSSYVKDVYEEVTHYLKTILEKAAENGFDSGRIIGEHTCKFDAKVILEAGTWESVVTMITESVFQSLESERSTLKLFQKISSKLALDVDQNLIDAALPYLGVRHFLVHADGKLPKEFIKENPMLPVADGYVQLDYKFVCELRSSVRNLIKEFDEKVLAKKILKEKDTQP